MGFFEEIVERGKKAASDASNAANRAISQVQSDVSRSDIGKATQATILDPMRGVINSQERLFRGDLGGSVRSLGGTALDLFNTQGMLGRASSSYSDWGKSTDLNKFSFDYFKNSQRAGELNAKMESGDALTSQEQTDYLNYGKSTALFSAEIYGANAAAGAYQAGNYGTAALYAKGTSDIYNGNLKSAASVFGAPDFITDGLSDSKNNSRYEGGYFSNTSDPRRGPANVNSSNSSYLLLAAAGLALFIYLKRNR